MCEGTEQLGVAEECSDLAQIATVLSQEHLDHDDLGVSLSLLTGVPTAIDLQVPATHDTSVDGNVVAWDASCEDCLVVPDPSTSSSTILIVLLRVRRLISLEYEVVDERELLVALIRPRLWL